MTHELVNAAIDGAIDATVALVNTTPDLRATLQSTTQATPLFLDAKRIATNFDETGIYVRAVDSDGKWGSHDIVDLTKESLVQWLRSRGGDNPYAENVVCVLLGHAQ